MNTGFLVLLITLGTILLFRRTISMFITTQFAGTPISLLDLLSMNFKKVDVEKVGTSFIMLRKANIDIEVKDLEAAYLLKHNLENITRGLIISKQKKVPLTFEQAKEADKKGIVMADELNKVD